MQSGSHQEMPKDDDDFQLYPCFNGLPSGSLDDYTFEVEALVAGSKGEKKLIGPRLVRRLGGVPGALARRELHMRDLAKPEGYKLISCCSLSHKGYKKDALDKRSLANHRTTSWTDPARLLCNRKHGKCRCCESRCWD